MKRHENWTGRRCCYLVQNPICRSTCALSGSRRNLNESCRPSDEPEFYSCLERREEAEHCCGKVSNDTCRTVCQNLFYKREKMSSRNGCFHQMPKCLKSVTEVKHAENPKQRAYKRDNRYFFSSSSSPTRNRFFLIFFLSLVTRPIYIYIFFFDNRFALLQQGGQFNVYGNV